MKIAFIRPSMYGRKAHDAMQPLVFAIIKGLTPRDVDIEFFDERVERLPDDPRADAVAMTVETFTASRAYQLADQYRSNGAKVIMGGFHPTMAPNECLAHADAVVIGDAEDTWESVLADLRSNTLCQTYHSANNADLSQVRYDYSVFEGKRYHKVGLVQFSRGCKYCCDFCSIHAFYRHSIRCKDVAVVVDEIRQMKERYLFFVDDNLFAHEAKARELFRALIPLKRKWVCQISMDVAKDPATLRLMRQSGCVMVVMGFESLSVDNLKQMKKGANIRSTDYREVISSIYANDLMIFGTFVIGYDDDTVDSVRDTVRFAIDSGFAIANFNPLMPMPGTRLYERLRDDGKLLHKPWWLDEGYRYGDAVLIPDKLTPAQLRDGCKRARYEFNSYGNIVRRLRRRRTNSRSLEHLTLFLLSNLVSRKEIMAKQGRRLGGQL